MNLEHFWDHVDKSTGNGPWGDCWIWQGMVQAGRRGGYGHVVVDGKIKKAHRVSWELTNGDIADGLKVLHRCDVRLCVNPEHLFLGTNQDNVDDKIRKGRHLRGKEAAQYSKPKRGEDSKKAKFTNSRILEFRSLYSSGMAIKDIADKFGEKRHVINMIVHGRRWGHIPGSVPPRRRMAKHFVETIRDLKSQGKKQVEIARLLNLSDAAISRVARNL